MKNSNNIFLLIVFNILISKGYQEIILQRCLPKADMENVTIKCAINEIIAIKEAFFTSSVVDQCPFVNGLNETTINNNLKSSNDSNNLILSCTDDLRLTLNSKCSGHSSCSVNIRRSHYHQCNGFDGWINLKYACVSKTKLTSYCNLQLSDNMGYVSNPGYPKFYPPYDCKWKIVGYPGQRIQIELLDMSVKEPRYNKKKLLHYECSDNFIIIDQGVQVMSLCGESKSNLIEYRSKTNELVIEFKTFEFSPTRGLLFKYTMIDCPTLKAPSNGYMYRNESFAYYSCYFDYVFEDTGDQNKILFCEYETYWNGTVTRCVAKENVTDVQIIDNNDIDVMTKNMKSNNFYDSPSHASMKMSSRNGDESGGNEENPAIIEEIEEALINPITLLIIGVIFICVVVTIIGMLIHSNRNHISNISL